MKKIDQKKILFPLFRIFYVFIFLAVICVILFSRIKRIRGNISVTVNGENYPLETIECNYLGENNNESIKCNPTSSGLTFKNRGHLHGMYEYSFLISNEEINVNPIIHVFKTNGWKIYHVDMDMNVYKDHEIYNADISINIEGIPYQKTFYDIEHHPIEFRIE